MDIAADQLVYGSFPFRAGGYDLLARSAGCSPELTAEVVAVCRRFGQPPTGEAAQPGLFAVRLPSGRWAVVGVVPQGLDDRGRPGALAFHALIVTARDYRKAGANPFAFAPALRADWSSVTPPLLDPARCRVEPTPAPDPTTATPKVARIVAALAGRKRVALETAGPIDAVARSVWASLPARVRQRASVATWAFANENRFDLVAFPRLVGISLDHSYAHPATLDEPAPPPVPPSEPPLPRPAYRDIRDPGSVVVAWIGLVVVSAATLAWSYSRGWFLNRAHPGAVVQAEAAPESPPKPRFTPAEAERARVGLEALATRFAAGEIGPASSPAQLMARLNEAYHYRGKLLTSAELDALGQDPDPDKIRALAWHDQVVRSLPDEPWPSDFAALPLPEQLAALGRSFHLDPTLPPEGVPAGLIAVLARPGLIRPTPLAARFPALSEYARFLGKFPRADDPAGAEIGR